LNLKSRLVSHAQLELERYDNSHGYSHRHYMGAIRPEPFTSYEELYDRFEQEWQAIAVKFVNGEEV
jgi:hypothetical protein